MSESKSRVTTHLRSAQDWLSKAQRSFDEQKDIRGELNLMLAQAELKRAQEEKQSSKRRYRHTLYRQGGALLCAVLLFGLGSLIWMSRSASDAQQAVTHVQTTPVQAISVETVSMPQASAVNEVDNVQVMSVSVETPYEEYNEAQPKASATILSQEEIKDLMKAAGRSLRGQ